MFYSTGPGYMRIKKDIKCTHNEIASPLDSEQGTLTEGETSVPSTSLYQLKRLATFDTEYIIYFFTKTS